MTFPTEFAVLDADEVARRLDYSSLFTAIEESFLGDPVATPRLSLPYQGSSPDSTGTFLLMSAVAPDSLGGVKIITYNTHRKAGTIKYIYIAFDPVSGEPLALIDGETLGTRRTAAVSVTAAKHLAGKGSDCIAVVGTGPVARELAKAYHTAYPAAKIELWGRRTEAVEAVVAELAASGIPVSGASDLDELVRRADIVSCATASGQPLIKGDLLRAGTHVDLIGGFTPTMREADDAVMRNADIIVVDNDSGLRECGDLCEPIAAGVLAKERVIGIQRLLADPSVRRQNELQRTVFKSVGHAIFDLATARLAVKPR